MRIPILLYHHIDTPPAKGTPSRSNYVTPQAFARQMRLLHKLGFKGLSLRDASPYLRGEKKGRVAIITFDDGFRSVYEQAMPLLNTLGFSATCFFVANQIDGENNWDAPEAKRAPTMNRDELKEWIKAGHEVGSHTLDHVRLALIEPEEARKQIVKSLALLENIAGTKVVSFAYPYGSENPEIVQMTKAAGYHYAVTTRRGRAKAGMNLYELPRHSIRRNDTIAHFLLKCLMR